MNVGVLNGFVLCGIWQKEEERRKKDLVCNRSRNEKTVI